ncbi:methyltransferase-like protein 25B isoform X1 [Anarrhichthys ocellatus]|uniref:methyltransferase-like protein 25B isoform X1 n=1 Tax=Anarrhichthys ocellatus TaxID=433405 RepID=UPI0012EE81C8|nr:protein RRNAD1 isoform X1 [Anarrhichthys ocellatus]
MFTSSFPAEQQRELAKSLTTFLSQYSHVSDSYIIEFFSKNHWQSLPNTWQPVLQDLTYRQVADLLLDATHGDRRYPSVWPLSLLAFRATAHALAFPRECRRERGGAVGSVKPEEFLDNQSQSSLLGHIFRKHVKPKKQHEIRKLGSLVKELCDQTDCNKVVDVGSGQGHLTRFLSFGLGLSVTAIEADGTLVATASKFDGQLLCALEKEAQKKVGASLKSLHAISPLTKNCSSLVPVSRSSPRHVAGWVNPKASWEVFIKQLSAAQCVNERSPTPPGPSKKRPRASEQVDPPCSHAVQTSWRRGSTDSPEYESTSQHQFRKSESEGASSAANCCSCVQSVRQEGAGPERGHPDFVLTGLHACGDLSATLLRHFVNCPHVRAITSVACCYMKITTKENPNPPGLVPATQPPDQDADPSEFGYPMSSWVGGLPGHRLSYKAREGACHAVEDYSRRLREGGEALRTHCYRATLETFIADTRPDLRRAGIQTIKKAHLLPFTEYARLGLARVGLPPGLPLDLERVESMLEQQGRVVVYFSLALLLAPVVETLVLLDRMIYLQENGVDSQLVPLFDPNFSPRNFVLVALKSRVHQSVFEDELSIFKRHKEP